MDDFSGLIKAQAARPVGQVASGASLDEGTLLRITHKISNLAEYASDVGRRLGDHADAVHGCVPSADKSDSIAPSRSGLIGGVEDALDRLSDALDFVSEQANRNCTLA